MADAPPLRKFSDIQADLEAVLAKLKDNHDPEQRREFLHRMRVLLQEATIVANSL
jgi:hypothetical protein